MLTPKQQEYAKYGVYAAASVLFLVIIVGGYVMYHTRREEQAHLAFVRAIDVYENAKRAQGDAKKASLEIAHDLFVAGEKKHARSSFGPLFKVYQSLVVADSGDLERSRDLLSEALKGMSTTSDLYYVYATRLALMLCDSTTEILRGSGEKQLDELANNKKNPIRDMALYYRGKMKFDALDYDGALLYWKPLIEQFATGNEPSAWAKRAQDTLEYRI
jgi:hypothetical protein